MNHLREKKTHRIIAVILAAAAALIVCSAVWLVPAYRSYVRQDRIDTCYNAMYSFGLWYHLEEQDLIRNGTPSEEIDYDAVARDIVRRHFGVELDETLSSDQICRAGGTWTIVIDPDTHKVVVQCTAPGHIWYVDGVDEDMLDTFRDMEY